MIEYDDFKKVEIRIGEIKSAQMIEKSDKLLLLQVDFGEEEPRTVVSGIAKYFKPEDLSGVQCAFVTNLEPRPLMGHLSEAMILGTHEGESFSLLTPSVKVAPGNILG
ncbi:MAG: hypothetical protein MRY49_03070 [Candidatus Pacebacteria bacterium]|nr:hypothetical protein [Candidatus Paceibacterota bacterium]